MMTGSTVMAHRQSILVVDDEPNLRESMRLMLEYEGYIVHLANSSEQAMTILNTQPVDLVLLDLLMPGGDGHRLMDRINDDHPSLPVIVITGHASLESAIEALRRKAYDYIRKPFDCDEFIKRVKNAIRHQALERENTRIYQELKHSEERYRYLVQNSPDLIYILDSNGSISFINDAATRLLGIPGDQLIGREFASLLADPDQEAARMLICAQHRGETTMSGVELQLRCRLEEDSCRTFEVRHIAMDEQSGPCPGNRSGQPGQCPRFLGVARDVSHHKRLLSQLHRAQKMESMGILASGVAHDLNNVLSGLVSYPELLLLDLPPDSHLRAPLQTIRQSGQKISAIIQDLLTLARRRVPISEPVNLNDPIEEYLASPEGRRLSVHYPQVRIIPRLATDLPNISGSPVHLGKTVMNLLSNAAEAMSDGGQIILTTACRSLDAPITGYEDIPPGHYVVLKVEDTGRGISPRDLTRIFEPFYSSKIMGRSGTGLGLAIVWATIKDHKGFVDVHSQPGQGTVFELFFPITRRKIRDDRKIISLDQFMGQGEHLLVVDDIKDQRDIASQILTKLGYRVDAVASGEDALAFLDHRDTDLLVLDLIMEPGLDGLDTYRRILKTHPAQRAIIVSGSSDPTRIREAADAGIHIYIRKPFNIETIAKAVRQALDQPDSIRDPVINKSSLETE